MTTKAQQDSRNGSSTSLNTQIEGLREELATVAGVVSQLAGPAGRKRLGRKAKKLGKSAQATLAETEGYITERAEAIEDRIRERPLQSALVAFAVGLVVGKLFLGNRS